MAERTSSTRLPIVLMLVGVPLFGLFALVGAAWSQSEADEAGIVVLPMFALAVVTLVAFEIGPLVLWLPARRAAEDRTPDPPWPMQNFGPPV